MAKSDVTSADEKPEQSKKKFSFVFPWKSIAEYIGVGFFNFLVAYVVLQLWLTEFSAPFRRGGDADWNPIIVRGIEKTGWINSYSQLGAPKKMTYFDVPESGDNLQWVAMKILSYFMSATQSVNVWYVLGFSIVAMSAYGAAKWWGLARSTAFVVATLYAFLPYHFFRNVNHLLLSMYAVIPIVLVYCYFQTNGGYKLTKPRFIILAIVAGSMSAYHAVFSCLMLLIACVYCALNKKWPAVKQTFALIVGIGAVFIFNLLPTIILALDKGRNDHIMQRSKADSETFGLQIVNMVMPRSDHRIELFAKVGSFVQGMGITSENGQSLGILISIGFFGVLLYALYCAITSRTIIPEFKFFVILSAILMIFTVSSGFTTLVSLVGLTEIRSWNRVVIIFAFIGLLACGFVFEKLQKKLEPKPYGKWLSYAILIFVFLFALWDQTSPNDGVNNKGISERFEQDCRYIKKVESQDLKHDGVFQFPFISFPESPPIYDLAPYEQGMLVLCDTNLRFSFGAMVGRDDGFQQSIAADGILTKEEVEELRRRNFSVIEVSRNAYVDRGAAFEKQLVLWFGDPIVSEDGSRAAYHIDK